MPSEVSFANHGVLFLDELPEFRRDALKALRQPVEDGVVTLARATATLAYPARFTRVEALPSGGRAGSPPSRPALRYGCGECSNSYMHGCPCSR
jgi:predicted ATPase with chaperone activity